MCTARLGRAPGSALNPPGPLPSGFTASRVPSLQLLQRSDSCHCGRMWEDATSGGLRVLVPRIAFSRKVAGGAPSSVGLGGTSHESLAHEILSHKLELVGAMGGDTQGLKLFCASVCPSVSRGRSGNPAGPGPQYLPNTGPPSSWSMPKVVCR